MRDLSNATGIGVDAGFLNGDLVDDQTQINEFINQDPIQFFQKLADLAGIVFNDLPDNETNDYQLIEALETVVRTYVATTILKGTVEKATQAESDAGTADKFPDAAAVKSTIGTDISAANGTLLTKKIDIGDWNMDSTVIVAIAHGIADWTKIVTVKVNIFVDDDSVLDPLGQDLFVADNPAAYGAPAVSGAYATNATTIVLSRLTGGWYDSVEFDKTSYNRGYMVIEYLP